MLMTAKNLSSMRVSRLAAAMMITALVSVAGCSGKQPIVERSDVAITDDVRAQLAADTQAGDLAVTVDTKGGVVSLTGNVPKQSDRNLVERIARDTAGVRSVDNSVMFGVSSARSDP